MAADFSKGELIWFDPGVGHVLPGEVVEFHRAAQVLTVQAVIAGKPEVFTLTNLTGVRRRQDLGHSGIEDMIQLSDLDEASLLWNLKIRYDKELIYTYAGSILVAVNPYKMFDVYGIDMVKKYEGQILGTLPPHLFAIGSAAYAHLSKEGSSPVENQVVVISGESGSGKTESTKLVMQYLAAVNKAPSNLVTEQILEASPLLESFGNAKTVRNDNSSRFGKYLEVHFKSGVILGAKVTEYLLEKSRIVTQAPEERNYHVFYEMLKGLTKDQKEKFGLLTAEKYFYLNQGGNCEIDGKYDGQDFKSLLSAMQVLGFSSDEQDTIFKILASVLHLGNVYFHRKQLKHGQEGVEIGSDSEIKWTGHLLQLDADGIRRAITTKTTEARNERLFTPLTIDQALDARDAFAKALYSALFSWLVSRINQIVYKGTKRTASISILDIFGFEDFKENSFEQLCINYANENLQFYFNKHIFKLEQQEYAKEKIDWQTISYTDNMPVINLISKKPVGILHLLDDESNFPKATDISFLEKCHYNHALNELYSRPRLSGMEFGIRHYAGRVWYGVEGFLDKNRDTLRQDVVELLISSKLSMLSKMFQYVRSTHEAAKTINKANGRFVTMKPRTPTVAARFHDSLQQLMELMSRCNPWFVRCIKPNNEKAPMKFDMPIVLEQLRYTGMLETIRIRKMGYPVRLRFSHFVERYRYLLARRGRALQRGTPYRELCRMILDLVAPNSAQSNDYQLGTSRVFLRENLERRLERERAKILQSAALVLQRHTRGYLARRRYKAMKKGSVVLQAHIRGWLARHKYHAVRKGVVRAQANFRAKRQRKKYLELKEELKRRAEVEKIARERAKARAQREEQERVSRAVAGVNHLEIPAELAFIFSKLDDWQPFHSERNLVKVVGSVPPRNETYHLPHDIDYHAFTKFTNVYFKSHLWGMKREPIKTPFLAKSKDIDYQDSLAIFKLILRFMNDNNLSGKKETVLGDYIVNKGIANEKMRDEILCQLCNQTWKNDNDANNERGWLLIANCLSVFPPTKTLYKYLLKYVSDHGYNGYKSICQKKLLQSARVESQLSRKYPPSLLEWRANRKRVNMALEVHFADGESRMLPVDSWTTSGELASRAVRERGISESEGWTLSLSTSRTDGFDETPDYLVKESNGIEYVLDLLSEMELPPAFPVCRDSFLVLGGDYYNHNVPKRHVNKGMVHSTPIDMELSSPPPRRPVVPPPEPPKHVMRKSSHEAKEANRKNSKIRSQSRDHTTEMGLSRKSALNDRYFEDKGRSRSLDNLLESELPQPRKLENLGLSHSRLNDRYHSIEKISGSQNDISLQMVNAVSNKEYMSKAEALLEENLESVSQRGGRNTDPNMSGHGTSSVVLDDGSRQDLTLDFDYPDISSQARSEDDKSSYIKGQPRFIKSHYAGKRAAPGSHSSRAYIETRNSEKSDYGGKSSALSDTSEAPSLASHVRRVRVPSQASDVDQFLDDLFMPVLDGNLDELSDARSLAASIKGGGDEDNEVAVITSSMSNASRQHIRNPNIQNVEDYVTSLFEPIFVNESLKRLTKASMLTSSIKGGGGMETHQHTSHSQGSAAFGFTPIGNVTSPTPIVMSPPPMMMPTMPLYTPAAQAAFLGAGATQSLQQQSPAANFMSVPIYNMQGLSLPTFPAPAVAPNDQNIAAYQQNLQRAFLQSAMAQNLQIQQQLLAQNQALQQMLQQPITPQTPGMHMSGGPHQMTGLYPPYDMEGRNSKVSFQEPNDRDLWSSEKRRNSPVPPLPPKSKFSSPPRAKQETVKAQVHRAQSPVRNHENGISRKSSTFSNVLSELKGRKTSMELGRKVSSPGAPPPPPPPMPPPPEHVDPSETRPFLDPYGRAKTVRIGKWRWPPPKSDHDESSDSFLQFKLRQHQRKTTPQRQQHSQDFSDFHESVEWEEFDLSSSSNHHPVARKESQSNKKEERDAIRAFEVGAKRPTPGSIGKLRISSEMRTKLEMVTANHSLRGSKQPEKPSVPLPDRDDVPRMPIKKLEDNRRNLLEQQLAGRWGSVDSVDAATRGVSKEERSDVQQTNIVRSQVERMEKNVEKTSPGSPPSSGWDKWEIGRSEKSTNNGWRPAPPPPPVTPHFLDAQASTPTNSFSQSSSRALPTVRSPPEPVRPTKNTRDLYHHQNGPDMNHSGDAFRDDRDGFNRDLFSGIPRSARLDRDRRSSVSTHLTDKMERIEIEESSEFLKPIDGTPPTVLDRRELDRNVETIKTKLYGPSTAAYFTYNRISWKINVRKEVFLPSESLSNPLALHLVFCQVVQDCLNGSNIRISREHRAKMKKLLDSYGITTNNINSSPHKVTIKKNIVDLARDWPLYFARIFPVLGGHQHPTVQHLAISHSGVRLLRKENLPHGEHLQILDTFGFDEIAETSVPKSSAVQILLTSGVGILLYTHGANQIHLMIEKFMLDSLKLQQKNVVVQNRVSQTQMNKSLPPVIDNWTGGGAVVNSHHHHLNGPPPSSLPAVLQPHSLSESVGESPGQHDGKHSLLQFAMLHFRQSPEKFEMLKTADGSISGSLKVIESLKNKKNKGKKGNKENEWTWREQVAMVKFTPVPIEQSLLRMESNELNELAVECFVSVMRYMGDLPMPPDVTEVKCVYTILMHCHKHESLRDEVYCQLMKQTTNNKSNKPDSCQRGWRLFSIVAAYFICSDVLKPYLFKYLETAAYDKRRAYHGTAMVCLQNLRKTFKYGGRKNVPSVEEITAVSAGRNAKRQIYRLPGGTERVINTKSTTVVQDIIEEMCAMINVKSQHETEEFSLYCIVEGDTFTMPLAREEYILDVTTELHKNQQVFYLIFCRSVWHFPLRLESRLYIEVVFNQIAPDYLEGLLLVLPGEQLEQDVIYDIAKMASLLHRAADMTHVPGMKETKFLLPKPALAVRDVKPAQWVNMVQSNWREVEGLQTVQAKAQVLDILSKWPLFGSSFFAVKLVSDPKERNEHILALNRHGVHFLDLVTHETLIHYSYSEVISTRKVKSEDGTLFLDMKCGNLMQQRITRLQTDQAHEISRLIRQYITMEQRLRTS